MKYRSLFEDEEETGPKDIATAHRRFPGLFDDDVDIKLPPGLLDDGVDIKLPPGAASHKEYLDADKNGKISSKVSIDRGSGGTARSNGEIDLLRPPPPGERPQLVQDKNLKTVDAVENQLANDGGDDEDESMFEMKYYEERAKRMRLESKVLELEKQIRALIKLKSPAEERGLCDTPDMGAGEVEGSGDEVMMHADPLQRGNSQEEEDPVLAAEKAAAREREIARRQRLQRRPVSTSSRRLGHSIARTLPGAENLQSGGAGVGTGSKLESVPEVIDNSEPQDRKSKEQVSNVLTWSSDDDDTKGKPEPLDSKEAVETNEPPKVENELKNLDDPAPKRRQKAYRPVSGARPTSRRLASNRNGTKSSTNKKQSGFSGMDANPGDIHPSEAQSKRKNSLGGYDKWSDSDESDRELAEGGVCDAGASEERHRTHTDSFEWDSDPGMWRFAIVCALG